jgi:hypothetical protein
VIDQSITQSIVFCIFHRRRLALSATNASVLSPFLHHLVSRACRAERLPLAELGKLSCREISSVFFPPLRRCHRMHPMISALVIAPAWIIGLYWPIGGST